MQEIKFRAWSKSENLMGEVTGFRFSKSQYPFVNARFRKNGKTVDEGYHFGQEDGCDSVILMQFTGLYDKNGVEIYEGDIVEVNYTVKYIDPDKQDEEHTAITRVYWNDFRASFALEFHKFANDDLYRFVRDKYAEVIGNIYDNPELLEVPS